jgi:PhzF family phenazine biosynthesis protein
VFEDARGLDDAQMQALALQMNLSETTFVVPATSSAATARVRIFTPTMEMPFAGHPTLGTAHVIAAGADRVTLELPAGLVPVVRDGGAWTLRAAKAPTSRRHDAPPAELARALGLPADAIGGEPRWVDTGVEQLVVPLRSPADVLAAKPDAALIDQHAFLPARGEAMIYAVAGDQVRFFFTAHGSVIEDPATGSACANLGGYLLETGASLPLERTLNQGAAVGRPSRLQLRVAVDRSIYVTGTVVDLARGELDL